MLSSIGGTASKMKFLHITDGDKKFIPPLIDFIKRNFDESRHEFIVYSRFKKRKLSGIRFLRLNNLRSLFEVRKKIRDVDGVILHGLLDFHLVANLMLMPRKAKFHWLIWGGDLYCYQHRKKSLKNYVRYLIRKLLIKRIGNVGSYFYGEVALAKDVFGFRGKWEKCLLYTSNASDAYFPKKRLASNSTCTRFLVGNSGYEANNHLLVFQKLHSQKEFRDFKVICPLAYGNSIYIKEVIARGNDLFGDKFEARQSFLPHQDYLNFLQEIDIAILDSSRQMGFGNIVPLLCFGKTLYLRHDIEPAQTLLKIGFRIGDAKSPLITKLAPAEVQQNITLSARAFSTNNLISHYKSFGFV